MFQILTLASIKISSSDTPDYEIGVFKWRHYKKEICGCLVQCTVASRVVFSPICPITKRFPKYNSDIIARSALSSLLLILMYKRHIGPTREGLVPHILISATRFLVHFPQF